MNPLSLQLVPVTGPDTACVEDFGTLDLDMGLQQPVDISYKIGWWPVRYPVNLHRRDGGQAVLTFRSVVKFSRFDRTWDKSMVAIDDRGSANDNQECGCEVLAA